MHNSDFNILIGDSDPATLSRVHDLLQEEEFRVWTSDDPGEILRISASGRFDLFIFDINIYAQLTPQGFQIETREDSTPVIIMTTDDDFELTVAAIKEGAVDFLDKPVRVKRLLITIRNALLHSSKLKQMRRDQDELSSLKELYERIINGIDYGIVVLDQNLKIESINDYIERKRQKEKSNYIGKHCYRYFYERTSVCDECKIKAVFNTGSPVKYNLVNKAVGGLNYYLEVEAFPLFDQKGQVNRVVQLVKDVTERIHLEKELREKKEYLESLVSHAPVGIFSTDAEGFIRTANLTFAQLMGVKNPQDTLGLNVLENEDFKTIGLDQEFRKVLEEGQHLVLPEIRCHTAWGSDTICGLRVVPLKGENEEITGLISTVADVTEKWQLEESYRKRITELSIFKAIGELLQSTIEPSDIYTIALIGITAGKGLGFNRAFLLRYDKSSNMLNGEAAIGPSDTAEANRIWSELDEKDLSLIEIFEKYKEDRHNHDIQINQIVRELEIPITWEEGFIQEVLFQSLPKKVKKGDRSGYADQKLIAKALDTEEFAAAPIISRGKPVGVIIADNQLSGKGITDEDLNRLSIITNQTGAAVENSLLLQNLEEKVEALRQAYTDLKENRDLLLRAERLSVVGEVAASVAHEIRNPLTSIGGFTRAVLRDLEKSEKTRTNRRFLTIILEEVKRLERIVNDILGFVKPVSSRFAHKNLNAVIEQTFSMMEGEIDQNRIIITRDYDEDLPDIWMDEDQIRQVILNVFRNAIHAMKDGGMLSVITQLDQPQAKVYIADTGIGIPPKHHGKLFNAFFTTKETGSGLGLTVSNQIIRNHGGTIEVESQEGEGSTFIITLPLRGQEENHEEEDTSSGRREESAHSIPGGTQ